MKRRHRMRFAWVSKANFCLDFLQLTSAEAMRSEVWTAGPCGERGGCGKIRRTWLTENRLEKEESHSIYSFPSFYPSFFVCLDPIFTVRDSPSSFFCPGRTNAKVLSRVFFMMRTFTVTSNKTLTENNGFNVGSHLCFHEIISHPRFLKVNHNV